MPPEGSSDAYPGQEETMPMLTEKAKGDAQDRPSHKQPRWHPLEAKHVVKLLVLVDMFSVALVVPLLSSYFRDLSIR